MMGTIYEKSEDYDAYIRSKNLTIDTVEKIVSFFTDREWCREDAWFKRRVVQHVYGKEFSRVWPLVIEALGRRNNGGE
jgi:hypothetical protein